MALPINIEDLIRQRKVEGARIEYKKGWNPEKVLHTICAFANDIDNWGGGYVVIGVEDDNGRPKFPIVGVREDEVDGICKELLEKCNLIEPRYLPAVEHVQYEGAHLLVIWVTGGVDRPYKCPEVIARNANAGRAFYIRKLASTVKANANEERELFDLAGDVPFDDRVNREASVADLRQNLIGEYLYRVKSDLHETYDQRPLTEVATDMRIVRGPVEDRRPLNVGLMFFNPRPDDFFRCAQIDVVDKPDPTGEGMVEKVFRGPLHTQLEGALEFIRNYILKEKIFKYDDRPQAGRFWNYPYKAVEEALSNAVYHKSYRTPEPITVMVTPDRMEITSIPGPDRTITDEDMRNWHFVSRRSRNRRIGDFLKELDLVEGRNTGMPQILSAMRDNGSPEPIFLTDNDRTYSTFVLPVHPVFLADDQVGTVSGTVSGTVNGTVSGTVNGGVNGGVSGGVSGGVFAAITKHPGMRVPSLVDLLGMSRRSVERCLAELVAQNLIDFRGAPKNGGYFVIQKEGTVNR